MVPTNSDDSLRTANDEPSVLTPGTVDTAHLVSGSSPVESDTAAYRRRKSMAELEHVSVVVPGYEIEGVLGRGGMGIVYKARHLALKRHVALKMIRAGGHAGPGDLARFRIEAEAVARLQHPNIVQIHEVGEAGGHPYCALEFVEGENLARKMGGQPLLAREAARLVEALARAMQLAHSHNVVHRDLKPANILLAADGTPKITDFGLARNLDRDSGETQAGAVIGTPSYMAPEQAAGRASEAGPAADVYALGAVLYECLTGKPPFKGQNTVETLDLVRTQEPVPPSRRQPRVPLDLETICLKCLRKEPENRYASAAELADDLARYQHGEPIRARPVGRIERAVKWMKRNPAVAAAVLAVVLALAGGTAVSYLKYRDAEQQKSVALHEAIKAKKVRDFLVSIFRISENDTRGGNITARQILADAEKRIPVEFANQPELRAELAAAIDQVHRNIERTIPAAMILEVRGSVALHSDSGVNRPLAPQMLVFRDNRLTLAADAEVRLVFLSDLHQEWLKPGRETTIGRKGCEPADAVRERTQDILMTFVPLPKGTFYMGGGGGRPGKKTEITEDFEIAVHPVTQGQWQAVMGQNPSDYKRNGKGRDFVLDVSDEELKLFPVDNVSWDNVQEFIKKLNELEKGRGWLYRLPSEAEWEYACRGGATSAEECSYSFYLDRPTNALSADQANFNGNYPVGKFPKGKFLQRPTRVGAHPANKLGLCDVHGNVWEWCSDVDSSEKLDQRVMRGGSWLSDGGQTAARSRALIRQAYQYCDQGFRLARVAVR